MDDILNGLATATPSYRAGGSLAAEPLALAAMALGAHGRTADAARLCQALTSLASADGSVGIAAGQPTPGWPTGLAVLAWSGAGGAQTAAWREHAERGAAWLLATGGKSSPRSPGMGHDTTLRGWPWAEGTHSWLEPTIFGLLALKRTGRGDHARAREAVRLLIDRLLPDGGCNYGNTSVLGQLLRPHLAPSGLALAALAGERDESGRIERTIAYLERTLDRQTTSMSLAYGLIGLAAHDRSPPAADAWLQAASERGGREAAPFQRALLALAALKAECPLIFHKPISHQPS
ncbi:MAG TPA: hypothetical protein VMV10_23665 [Pirellulales bacterium]|nr:hypothetical protein [Pirellulales bacterium]